VSAVRERNAKAGSRPGPKRPESLSETTKSCRISCGHSLLRAAENGRLSEIRWLARRADMSVRDMGENTALMLACRSGFPRCAALLLSGSDSFATNSEGKTALMCAAMGGSLKIIQKLLSISAIDAVDYDGHNALMLACSHRRGNPEIIRVLATERSLKTKSRSGLTALDIALAHSAATEARVLMDFCRPQEIDAAFAKWSAQTRQKILARGTAKSASEVALAEIAQIEALALENELSRAVRPGVIPAQKKAASRL